MTVEVEQRVPVRRSKLRFGLTVVGYAVPLLVAIVVTEPGVLSLSDVTGFLHVASFPLAVGLGWLGVALLLGLLVLVVRRRFLVWLLVVATLAGGVSMAKVAWRGFGDGLPAPASGVTTVVTVNTLNESVPPARVASLVVRTGADAVAMPETAKPFAAEVAARLAERGRRMQVFGGVPTTSAWPSVTSLLVSDSLGRYEAVPQPPVPTLDAVVVRRVGGAGPTIAAVHTPPPFLSVSAPRAWEAVWRDGAARAVDLCRRGRADVVFGDVNSTVDHEPLTELGHCADAAVETGGGAEGTWPARAPSAFAAPIDHVFFDARSWRAVDTGVTHVEGSDHRTLVAQLRRA